MIIKKLERLTNLVLFICTFKREGQPKYDGKTKFVFLTIPIFEFML